MACYIVWVPTISRRPENGTLVQNGSAGVEARRRGTFRGEGILAVTKALLQSGVSYVGGYQGAPVSHLLDVLVDAEDIMSELGVHLETCTNEASAAAMLGASINYPLRGAVTWKSIVGTNVAADALSNLASPGVIGGAMIILGEDYGEGASVIQERSYAYAMKSSMWLLDPRPDLPSIVRSVEKGFELSEASHAPVMLELRIRACHVTGEFTAKGNRNGTCSARKLQGPPRFDYARLAHPPVTFARAPQGRRAAAGGTRPSSATTSSTKQLAATWTTSASSSWVGSPTACCALWSGSGSPTFSAPPGCRCSSSTWSIRWCPRNCARFARARAPCWSSRKVIPTTSSRPSTCELRRADINTPVLGKGLLPNAGEYASDVLLEGLAAFLQQTRPKGIDADAIAKTARAV